MVAAIIATVVGLLLLVVALVYYAVWRAAIRSRPPEPSLDEYPSVTVIRPIKGLDWGVEGNLKAALEDEYPGSVETFFVFDSKDEPALPLARKAVEAHRDEPGRRTARILFCGEPPPGRTGKLNAMIRGLSDASGTLVAFCDSDVRTGPHALTRLVDTLCRESDTGSAFAPVVVTSKIRTFGDAGYALLLNGLYGPVTAAVAERNGYKLPFIMGQFMVLTRGAIKRIGGLSSLEGQLVDDMYLGARVRSVGLNNRVSSHRVSILQQGMTMKDFWGLYTRWITFSRSGLPGWGFRMHAAMPVALYWVALILAVVSLFNGWWLAALVNALSPAAVTWIYANLHHAFGGQRLGPIHRWAALFVLLLAPVIFVVSHIKRQVSWRGHVYELDSGARLNSVSKSMKEQEGS